VVILDSLDFDYEKQLNLGLPDVSLKFLLLYTLNKDFRFRDQIKAASGFIMDNISLPCEIKL
jgi:hypothetical protein